MVNDFIKKIEQLSDKLFRTIISIVRNRDDALDLVQETYIKVYTKGMKNSTPVNDGYFLKTAYNLALNSKRNSVSRQNKDKLLSINFNEQNNNNPELLLENAETRTEIVEALNQLSERQKEIITYRFIADMKISDIAKLLSLSEGSVKVHLSRGLQHMKKILVKTERI